MAFYRIDNEQLIKSENSLFGPGFDLLINEYANYEYPVEGWYWFDTDEEAESALSVKMRKI